MALKALTLVGTYVDEKIIPHFYYRVRKIGSGKFLFDGGARRLISIGRGYGKRITFQSENGEEASDMYFYSDTEPRGQFRYLCWETHNLKM